MQHPSWRMANLLSSPTNITMKSQNLQIVLDDQTNAVQNTYDNPLIINRSKGCKVVWMELSGLLSNTHALSDESHGIKQRVSLCL